MVVYPKHLLLIGSKFSSRSLYSELVRRQHLFEHKIPTFNASKMECVLERKPTAAEPCLTASSAYSTWCSRPCGEKTVLSESYVFLNMMDNDRLGWS